MHILFQSIDKLFDGACFLFRRTCGQSAKPVEVQVTPYKTTMLANGRDEVLITAKIIDGKGNEVPGITKPITYKIAGDAPL